MALSDQKMDFIKRLIALSRHVDTETATHVIRVGKYASVVASVLGADAEYVGNICHAAQLHDIGKIGVPDYILKKRGSLTADELDQIRRHTQIGATIISNFSQQSTLQMAADIAQSHHEAWDGSGYPQGLTGEEIPLAARFTSIADVYDALRAERPYKSAFTHEKAVQTILEGDGRTIPYQFDPRVLDAFSDIHEIFAAIYSGCFGVSLSDNSFFTKCTDKCVLVDYLRSYPRSLHKSSRRESTWTLKQNWQCWQ